MRRFLMLTAMLAAVIASAVPTVNGWWLRHQITNGLAQLPATPAFRLEFTGSRGGWLDSVMTLRLHGEAVNAPPAGIPLELSLAHGPLVRQLPDSPWGLAQLRLDTAPDYDGPGANRYSGAMVARINRSAELAVRGILGGAAFNGNHQFQFSGHWPLLAGNLEAALREARASLYMEWDAEALLASPAAARLFMVKILLAAIRVAEG